MVGKTILVTDDALFMRRMLSKMLEEAGYEVIQAVDGDDAVQKYKANSPDVVTLDITMPNCNGIEAATKIREHDGNARIIMCTAMGQESMVKQAATVGVKDFIVKPFDEERVLAAVANALGH